MNNFSVCVNDMVQHLLKRKNKKDQLPCEFTSLSSVNIYWAPTVRKEPWWIHYTICVKKPYSDYRKHRWDMDDQILILSFDNEYQSCVRYV